MPNITQQTEITVENPQAPIFTLQAGKGLRPFFFLHGDWWSQAPIYAYALSRSLGRKRPFYALEPYHFDGPNQPLTLEALAAEHVKAIKQKQPEGPYLLGGYCNGALIACEIVRQLQAREDEVRLMVMITPSTFPVKARKLLKVSRTLCSALHISPSFQRDIFLRVRHARRHLLRYVEPADHPRFSGYGALIELDSHFKTMFPPLETLHKEYAGYYAWLAGDYQPDFDSTPTRFIWVEEDLDKRPRWQAFEPEGVPVTILPGTHLTCVTEHSGQLSEHVKSYVEQVETDEA